MTEEMITNKKITVVHDGKEKEADVISVFTSEKFNKQYILYTFNEKHKENIKILASTLVKDKDSYVLEKIKTDEEWEMVKSTIKELAKQAA